ncbi:hypothetical protein O9992_12695 [Vibrio lentus]|nr:hypothetical protein [Vibrio lentus]
MPNITGMTAGSAIILFYCRHRRIWCSRTVGQRYHQMLCQLLFEHACIVNLMYGGKTC